MNLYEIEDGFSVAPQPVPADFQMLADLGVRTIINNRPDNERGVILPSNLESQMAKSHGMEYLYIPVSHNGIDMASLEAFQDALANSPRPVVAHCASGHRSAIMWALASAATKSPDDIIQALAARGFNLSHLRPILVQLSQRAA